MIEFENEEVPLTCLGKKLVSTEDHIPLGIPMDVLVVAKTIDEDGDPGYRFLCNEELDLVNGMGMIHWAKVQLETHFSGLNKLLKGDEDAEEEGA